MNLTTTFKAHSQPETVFAAFHQYKIKRRPGSFFHSRLVKWRFHVLTDHTLGLGAVYDWKIWLFGIPILAFKEQVVEWREGECVAYRAIWGWEMDFRIDLQPDGEATRVTVDTDLALPGPEFLNRLLRPAYEWGLRSVCRRGLHKEGIRTT